MIKNIHDQHIHTKFSPDSKEELENYYKLALANNMSYFICCDHTDIDLVHTGCNWLVDFDGLKAELAKMKLKYPSITPLLGIELGFRKDKLNQLYAILNENKFDLINLSVHDNGIFDYYVEKFFNTYGIDVVMMEYFNNLYDAVTIFKDYDVLSHIDYGFRTIKLMDRESDFFKYQNDLIRVLKVLIETNKALEVNTKVQEGIADDNHLIRLLELYKSLGGYKLTLSSDAHSASRYCSSFDKYMKIIKKCGFNELRYYVGRKEQIFEI